MVLLGLILQPKSPFLNLTTQACSPVFHTFTPALSEAFVQGAGSNGVGTAEKREDVWDRAPVDSAPAFQQQQSEFPLHSHPLHLELSLFCFSVLHIEFNF